MQNRIENRIIRSSVFAVAGLLALTLGGCSSSGIDDSGEGVEKPLEGMTIDYIIPYGPGGSTDPVGREFSRMMADELGAEVAVSNVPGGETTIGVSQVINSKPDGLTIGLSSIGGTIIEPIINKDIQYSEDDFQVIAKMTEAPNAILVSKDSPLQTFEDFLADAKKRPGEIRVGGPGTYISTGFVTTLLEEQAGIQVTHVPYSGGSGEAVLGVMAGEVEAVVVTASAQLGLIESGEVRALAYTGSSEYGENLPGAVSFEEAGYDIPFGSDYMTFMPVGIPDNISAALTHAAEAVSNSDEWAEWCKQQGYIATPMTPDEIDIWFEDVAKKSQHAIDLFGTREQS